MTRYKEVQNLYIEIIEKCLACALIELEDGLHDQLELTLKAMQKNLSKLKEI